MPHPRTFNPLRPLLACTLALSSAWLAGCATHVGQAEDTAPQQPAPVAYRLERDLVYSPPGWPQTLRADVYRPTGIAGPYPTVLLIHGGGWAPPDRRGQMESIARRLVQRGYLVMNATYRLAPEHKHPAPVEDLLQALRWLQAQQSALQVDVHRLATFGYSAGGHLAALVGAESTRELGRESSGASGRTEAAAEGLPRVRAVVSGAPPTDVRKWPDGRLVVQYLGGTLAEMPQRYAQASPVAQVHAQHPPVFLYHGQSDTLVPPDHSVDYHQALQQAGIRSELYLTRGLGHITAFLLDGPAVDAALAFLDRELQPPRAR